MPKHKPFLGRRIYPAIICPVHSTDIAQEKQRLREYVWELLAERGIARFPGAFGRIPNFVGAEEAASRATSLPEFQRARFIQVNPDSPQFPLRVKALEAGKVLFMATPKLKGEKPFIRLDPQELRTHPMRAATIKGAFRYGVPVTPEEIPPLDLVIVGCVAVTLRGARLGKGGGFADREYALLREAKLIYLQTPVLTTVHPLQILEHIPQEAHDLSVSIIVTPEGTWRTKQNEGRSKHT